MGVAIIKQSDLDQKLIGDWLTEKKRSQDKIIALAGNPNVGKSTTFNALTGLNQHTGNWPGKTVVSARGSFQYKDQNFTLVDLPGTYSLMAHSAEEEVARNFICFAEPDAVAVVCDATCLERNLNLLLQIIETGQKVIVCVNLLDEAAKKQITVDLKATERLLRAPVVGITARDKKGMDYLLETLHQQVNYSPATPPTAIPYPQPLEEALNLVIPHLTPFNHKKLNHRWLALRLLENDDLFKKNLESYLGKPLSAYPQLTAAVNKATSLLLNYKINKETIKDLVVSAIIRQAELIAKQVVTYKKATYNSSDRRLDKFLTSRRTGIPVMLALLALVFWITIIGANYPSQLLDVAFTNLEILFTNFLISLNSPDWLTDVLSSGILRTLGWVVAVMLPPMAIFFPLFTLLEDSGYLPRIAFNLDKYFQKACACGKQALTMCMGFGCNAAGVIGCRIIDSPRERLIAILTNVFVPCNGRFPTLIILISLFFVSGGIGSGRSIIATLFFTGLIILSVLMTLLVSRLLSKTILKGVPSSFTLELPPYRRPQVGRVIVSSIRDRTLFVLARAVMVAAPAGLIIWILANVHLGGVSLLSCCADFLNPFAQLMGLDGTILLAFILGFRLTK
jgi:ferrous iron transport protein B